MYLASGCRFFGGRGSGSSRNEADLVDFWGQSRNTIEGKSFAFVCARKIIHDFYIVTTIFVVSIFAAVMFVFGWHVCCCYVCAAVMFAAGCCTLSGARQPPE